MNNLANSYVDLGRGDEALTLLRETLDRRQKRLAAQATSSVEPSFAAWTHGQIGQAEQLRHDYAAALEAYGTSVDMFAKLDQAGKLNQSFFRYCFNFYQQRLALCRKAEQAVKNLDFALQQPAAEVPGLLDIRMQALVAKKDQAGVVATAEAYAKLAEKDPKQTYNAACAWSISCGLVKDDAKLRDEYAGNALALLKKTPTGKDHSFATPAALAAHMKQDKDFDPLRERDDFKKLLAELEKEQASPDRPDSLKSIMGLTISYDQAKMSTAATRWRGSTMLLDESFSDSSTGSIADVPLKRA